MAELKKEGLLAGTYFINRDGKVQDFVCNQNDLEYFQKRLNDMVSKGNHIPITWEHQPNVERPLTKEEYSNYLAEKTKHTFGQVKSAVVDKDRAVEMVLDVPDEENAKKLPSIKFVSPTILTDVTDPLGNFWPGPSITALAVTAQPVQVDQKPFERMALSINDHGSWVKAIHKEPLRLSEGINPVANSGNNFVQLLQVLASQAIGLVLPPDTTPANFLDRLYVSALTKATMITSGGRASEVTMPVSNGMAGGVSMSQNAEATKKVNEKIAAAELASLNNRVVDLYKTGRITPHIRKELEKQLKEIRLSVNDSGEVSEGDIHVRLKVLEQLPESSAIKLGSTTTAKEHDIGGFGSPSRVQEMVNETVEKINGKKKPY